VDTDARTDKVWLLNVQRKLYQWSRENPEGQYRELWGWITDSRNLQCAWRTVATNKGKRTPGIGGVTECDDPITLWSLESRVRNERRTLGSERGYGRPGVERPYGARSLFY